MMAFTAALVAIAIALCGAAAGHAATAFSWPEIVPVRRSFYFPEAPKAEAALEIRGPDGTPLYRLQCYGPQADRSRLDPYPGDLYTGEFDCHLYPVPNESGWETLLLDKTDPVERTGEAYGRGVVDSSELVGACGGYPEYGRVRHFRLRGMRVTFRYSDVRVQEVVTSSEPKIKLPVLRAFRFTVDVGPDPTAVSAMAETVPFAAPRPLKTENPNVVLPNCQTVIRQHVPGSVTETYVRRHGLEPPYPKISPVEAENKFMGREPGTLRLPVPGTMGKPAYVLACKAGVDGAGSEAGLDEWAILCRLYPAASGFDLLADAVDPYSQARPALTRPDEFYGGCAGYPDWGAERVFRLRGFRLTLRLLHADFAPVPPNYPPRLIVPQFLLNKVDLRASVEPDPAATSPVALPPSYIYWGVSPGPNACEQVLVPPGKFSGAGSGR